MSETDSEISFSIPRTPRSSRSFTYPLTSLISGIRGTVRVRHASFILTYLITLHIRCSFRMSRGLRPVERRTQNANSELTVRVRDTSQLLDIRSTNFYYPRFALPPRLACPGPLTHDTRALPRPAVCVCSTRLLYIPQVYEPKYGRRRDQVLRRTGSRRRRVPRQNGAVQYAATHR